MFIELYMNGLKIILCAEARRTQSIPPPPMWCHQHPCPSTKAILSRLGLEYRGRFIGVPRPPSTPRLAFPVRRSKFLGRQQTHSLTIHRSQLLPTSHLSPLTSHLSHITSHILSLTSHISHLTNIVCPALHHSHTILQPFNRRLFQLSLLPELTAKMVQS